MPQRNCGEPWSSTAHIKNIKGNKCGMGKQNYRWQYFWQNIDMMKRMLQNIKHEEIKCKILSVIFLMNISFYSKTVKKKKSALSVLFCISFYTISDLKTTFHCQTHISHCQISFFLIQWVVPSKNLYILRISSWGVTFINTHTISAV